MGYADLFKKKICKNWVKKIIIISIVSIDSTYIDNFFKVDWSSLDGKHKKLEIVHKKK